MDTGCQLSARESGGVNKKSVNQETQAPVVHLAALTSSSFLSDLLQVRLQPNVLRN